MSTDPDTPAEERAGAPRRRPMRYVVAAGVGCLAVAALAVLVSLDERPAPASAPGPSGEADAAAERDPAAAAGGGAQLVPRFALETFTGDLEEMQQRRFIRALVRPSRTDFFSVEGELRGLQYELLNRYEEFLNRENGPDDLHTRIVYVPVPFDELIPALEAGRGDIAAAMLTVTETRDESVDFVSSYRNSVAERVVLSKDAAPVTAVEDLAGREAYVLRGSSYAAHLRELNERFAAEGLEPIGIVEADRELRTEDILELVNAGVVELTIADDYKAELFAEVLTDMVVTDVAVAEGNRVGWAVRPDNPLLEQSLREFAGSVRQGTLIGNVLIQRYLGNTSFIGDPVDEQSRRRMTEFVSLFRRYGMRYEFDWLALMAQAYQESGLRHEAVSHAGAMGIMQLKPSTAADPNVGIDDITGVENNVHAGAKYMAFIRDRYFSEPAIDESERIAFTWAAYNAGPARVRRMRARATEMGLDPNQWFGHVEYAALDIVGQETVRYVANIYKYWIAYQLLRPWEDAGNR